MITSAVSRPRTEIDYRLGEEAWSGYESFLFSLIERFEATAICDVGGGANPALTREYLAARNIDYTVLDIDQRELEKVPAGYSTVCCDVCDASSLPENRYDLVITRMLAEHVKNAEAFHRGVLKTLKPGGVAFHYFPTLFCPPFLVNWLTPSGLSQKLLDFYSPRDKVYQGKFPAYYKWCRGPSQRQLHRFSALQADIVTYRGFFGHSYYQKRLKPLDWMSRKLAGYLTTHPVPMLTSFAYLVLQKRG
ncbi:MAG TPA: methyltransferase domain-containing protein [Pirellulales bacterium]|nr:methyltransferase domain-containing protein [Pirellulales bacterium]